MWQIFRAYGRTAIAAKPSRMAHSEGPGVSSGSEIAGERNSFFNEEFVDIMRSGSL